MGTLFYKYMKINDNTKNSILDKYFYFSQPQELNDPFDGIVPIIIEASEKELYIWCKEHDIVGNAKKKFLSDYKNGNLIVYANAFAEKASNMFSILCLSQVWNESMLWAHYTDSYKGLCIGYNTVFISNSNFLQLDLRNEANDFFTKTVNEYLCPLAEIKYDRSTSEPYNIFKKNYDAIKAFYLHKENKWSYEKEYRSLIFNNNNRKFSKQIFYRENILKEVIFGYNTSISDIEEIKSILRKSYTRKIRLFKIKINRNSMNLEKDEIAF